MQERIDRELISKAWQICATFHSMHFATSSQHNFFNPKHHNKAISSMEVFTRIILMPITYYRLFYNLIL